MPKKNEKHLPAHSYAELERVLGAATPQLFAVLTDEDDFISLYVKLRPDRTCLAVLKRLDSAGGPTVCFGSGYGVAGSLVGLEGSVAGNKWKVDKPWP